MTTQQLHARLDVIKARLVEVERILKHRRTVAGRQELHDSAKSVPGRNGK